jgi:hypothetical protein
MTRITSPGAMRAAVAPLVRVYTGKVTKIFTTFAHLPDFFFISSN